MTPDLTILTLALLLQAVQFAGYAIAANLDVGIGYSMSARDRDPSRPLSDYSGRLARAMNNHFEALILFAPAVFIVQLSGQNSSFTALCATVYLIARIAYVPAYYFGLSPWRSFIWSIGFGATIAMLASTLV